MHAGGGRYANLEATPDEEIDDAALHRSRRRDADAKKSKSEVAVNRKSFPQRSRDNETIRMYLKGKQRGKARWNDMRRHEHFQTWVSGNSRWEPEMARHGSPNCEASEWSVRTEKI